MTKYITKLWLLLVGIMGAIIQLSAQCPNCTINLPFQMPSDTIYLDAIPPGQKNQPYEEELTFRLPYTTSPLTSLDPSIPSGIRLSGFKVLGITGLPLGMSYVLDRAIPATYDETAPNTRDGCVILCGTPAQSGVFTVIIDVEAETGILAPQSAQIPLDFIVQPDSNAGFSVNVSQGCDSLWVNFANNVASRGNANVSYSWDFGNGETSTLENPDSVFYADTGTYVVNYEAIVDTFPDQLTQVIVTATSCSDPFSGAPDLYMILKDANGTELENTDPNTRPIIGTAPNQNPPDTVWTGTRNLTTGETYTIEIWDDDNDIPFDSDDACATYTITPPLTGGTLIGGSTEAIDISVVRYVDTIRSSEIIVVNDCSAAGVGYDQIDNSLRVFPNPTNGLVNLRFHLYGMAADASLQVNDLLGRNVFYQTLSGFEGNYNEVISLNDFEDGVYVLTLQVGEAIVHRKIVLQR